MIFKDHPIAIGGDHASPSLKKNLQEYFPEIRWIDIGPFDDEKVDYPIMAKKVTDEIIEGRCKSGILICGTGIGVNIAANKRKGIRAAVAHDLFSAQMAREHNDAQILCLGARVIEKEKAREIVRVWLTTEFSKEARHQKRIDLITEIEKGN